MPPIRFYLPDGIPADLPSSPDKFWTDFDRQIRGGFYAWIIQTWQRLQRANFPCELSSELPKSGILVAHRKSLPRDYQAPPGVFFVCVRADATFHPYAHLHVVQNRSAQNRWYPSVYLPHWPQVGLLPRETTRGDLWENAAFLGNPASLTAEMTGSTWTDTMREVGLNWHVAGPEKWHDYRTADVVVAVRSFDRQRHENKPPTKLFNAWHAGVPAVLGSESAYQQERRNPLDYLEARSVGEVIAALRQLKDNPDLRRAMVANGQQRVKETDPATITARWRDFFENVAIPAHGRWSGSTALQRKLFAGKGRLKLDIGNLCERLQRAD